MADLCHLCTAKPSHRIGLLTTDGDRRYYLTCDAHSAKMWADLRPGQRMVAIMEPHDNKAGVMITLSPLHRPVRTV